MRNKGEVYVLSIISEEWEEKVYVKQRDLEEVYVLSLAEGMERMRWCLEEMRKIYLEKGKETKETKKEEGVSLRDDNRESKIVVGE